MYELKHSVLATMAFSQSLDLDSRSEKVPTQGRNSRSWKNQDPVTRTTKPPLEVSLAPEKILSQVFS